MHDCLIVGGGVIGLSLAYELARRQVSVRLIDRGRCGREASWAGAGILPPAGEQSAVHPLDKLRGLSHRLHPEWAAGLRDETGIDTGYRRCGGLYLASSPGEAASLAGMAAMLREEGIGAVRLSPSEAAGREPALAEMAAGDRLLAAWDVSEESQLRNPDHLAALWAACRGRGVEISEQLEAVSIDVRHDRVAAVNTRQGPLHAGQYLFASGPWTRLLLEQIGIASGLMPVRGQMVMFRCERPPFSRVLNIGPRYLVPRDDGRVLAGSTEEEAGFDKSTTPEAIAELAALARSVVPALSLDRIERTWAGLRPGSFDGLPYLGRLGEVENAFVAAGHFRGGIHLSTGTAVVLADLITGRRPKIDLTPFRVTRG